MTLWTLADLFAIATILVMYIDWRRLRAKLREVTADAEQCRNILTVARLNPPRRQVHVPPRQLPPRYREF